MLRTFPFYRQRDVMDCGPTCLMMIAAAWGRRYSLPFLREHSYLDRQGVSALGIMEAAERIGIRTMTVRVPFASQGDKGASLCTAPLPCVAHWNQNHFVVVYKVRRDRVWIADPAAGKVQLSRRDFEKSWCPDQQKGILILFEPTPAFYTQSKGVSEKPNWLSHIFQYIRPYRRLVFQLLTGMAVASLFTLIFPFLTQSIVDFGINNRDLSFIMLVLVAQLMLFFSQMIVQFVQNRILLFVGARVNVAMINDFLAKLTRLPIGYFDTKMTGDLLQRIGDQGRVESFLTNSTLSVIFSSVNFIVFSLILWVYNPLIFMIFAVAATLYTSWIFVFLRRRRELDYVRFQQASDHNNALIELIQGMQEIKLQGSERKRRWIWAGIQAKLFQTNLLSMNLAQWQDAGAGFFSQVKNILISFVAARAVIEGNMTLGMMLATQYIVGQLDAPLQQFIAFVRAWQDAKISMDRMGEIQEQPDEDAPEIPRPPATGRVAPGTDDHRPLTPFVITGDSLDQVPAGDITIRGLSFRYNPLSEDVLNDIDLRIPYGKVTAIVGASGSGKTTLLKILLGFYKGTKGEVRIGNVPLHRIHPVYWRKQCGAVLQDSYIFSDTIANNISESDDYPDLRKLNNAAEIANIHAFIEDIPMGYNTKIGARGSGLSQGQRQRLLVARAVYKNPRFLFLDEATNALDANNERVIVENLQDFYRNRPAEGAAFREHARTVVVVAHRLSTVRHADQIVVLDRGKIVECGAHAELTNRRGAYFDLVKNQLELGV